MHMHASFRYGRAFAAGVALNAAYIVVEASFGLWTGSLALLSDAGHNLSDVLGLLMAWSAHALSHVRPSNRRTYGWRSSTILAALFNGLILLAAVGGIAWEAVLRLRQPPELPGRTIIAVAAVGVVVNTLTALLFLRGRKHDLNIRGAYLHMAADAGVSFGVVLAGIAMMWLGWRWIDPVASLAIATVILYATWGLLRESLNLAMHAVPQGIDPTAVRDYLSALPGVEGVHDLHIWAMSTTETALTAHLVRPHVDNDDPLLARIQHELHERFGILHATIQVERSAGCNACAEGRDHAT